MNIDELDKAHRYNGYYLEETTTATDGIRPSTFG
jgi:hypothetical protein